MTDNLNVNISLYNCNTAEEIRENLPAKLEEITVMKTEIKEEVYDFGMSVRDIEHVNVKEEYYSSEENMEGIKSSEQLLNENLVSENSQLREQDLKKKKILSKHVLHLKHKAECKRRILKPGEEPEKYRCADCKYATCIKRNLDRHIRTHANVRPFKCTYKNCECTPGQEEFCKCDICGYAATEEHNLKTHISRKHRGEAKKYQCTDCKYAAHLKSDLERHIRTHTKDRPFKCTYKNCECSAGQEESCKCNMCEYAAAGERYLKLHILMKHSGEPKKFKCADCEYAAHQKHYLERHIRTHTNDRPFKCTYKNCECTAEQKEFCLCDMCGYAAAKESNLKDHILVKHSGELKRYKCADCKFSAHKKHDLERHIRIHTNDRPFKCIYKDCNCTPELKESCKCNPCGYSATFKHILNRHILRTHTIQFDML